MSEEGTGAGAAPVPGRFDELDPPGAPAEPRPLGVRPAPTGNAEVDALLVRLADADALPTEGHIEVYEDVHRGLRDTLAALDAHPGPAGPGPGPASAGPSTTYDGRR